jgi:hypothetical protein
MKLIAAALLIALLGCSQSVTGPDASGQVSLRYGQSATVNGTRVSFAEVVEDSRCPKDVVCAWAGDAAIKLEAGTESVVLHTNPSVGASTAKVGGVTVTLIEVRPEPVSTVERKKTDYLVILRASE